MSIFQTSIQSVLSQMLREYDIRKLDPKYVNTAIFYFQQLESLEVLTKDQKNKWTESLSDAFLSAKELGFNQAQIKALNTYLDVVSKKIARIIPYYQTYKKVLLHLEAICTIRHQLGIGTAAYDVFKNKLKASVCPSDKEIKEIIELESFTNKRAAETRELGDYVVLSRKFATLLRNTATILMRIRQDYRPLEQTYTLFNSNFYNDLYLIPKGQMDTLRSYYDELLSANSLLQRVEKNLEDKNAQGQLMDAVSAVKRLSYKINEQVSLIKVSNKGLGLGDYRSDEGRVIRIDDVVGFKRKAA